jgi:hypothetical protein
VCNVFLDTENADWGDALLRLIDRFRRTAPEFDIHPSFVAFVSEAKPMLVEDVVQMLASVAVPESENTQEWFDFAWGILGLCGSDQSSELCHAAQMYYAVCISACPLDGPFSPAHYAPFARLVCELLDSAISLPSQGESLCQFLQKVGEIGRECELLISAELNPDLLAPLAEWGCPSARALAESLGLMPSTEREIVMEDEGGRERALQEPEYE